MNKNYNKILFLVMCGMHGALLSSFTVPKTLAQVYATSSQAAKASNSKLYQWFTKGWITQMYDLSVDPSLINNSSYNLDMQINFSYENKSYSYALENFIKSSLLSIPISADGVWVMINISLINKSSANSAFNLYYRVYSSTGEVLHSNGQTPIVLTTGGGIDNIQGISFGVSTSTAFNAWFTDSFSKPVQSAGAYCLFIHPSNNGASLFTQATSAQLPSVLANNAVSGIPLSKSSIVASDIGFLQYPNLSQATALYYDCTQIPQLSNPSAVLATGLYIVVNLDPQTQQLSYALYDVNGNPYNGSMSTNIGIWKSTQNAAYSNLGATGSSYVLMGNQVNVTQGIASWSTLPITLFLQYAPTGLVAFQQSPPANGGLPQAATTILTTLNSDVLTSTSSISTFSSTAAIAPLNPTMYVATLASDGQTAIDASVNVIVDLVNLIKATHPKLAQQLPTTLQTLTRQTIA